MDFVGKILLFLEIEVLVVRIETTLQQRRLQNIANANNLSIKVLFMKFPTHSVLVKRLHGCFRKVDSHQRDIFQTTVCTRNCSAVHS